MSLFVEAKTVGELKAILVGLSDDTVIFQTNYQGGLYRKKITVLNINKSSKHFDSWHRNIKIYQCTEDKIKGVYKDLKDIVIFGR
jgi:hypothetical protein